MDRLPAKPVPKASRMARGDMPPSRPVTRPATVTTSMGFNRRAKPTMTTTTPSRTSMSTPSAERHELSRSPYELFNNPTRGKMSKEHVRAAGGGTA